MHFLPKIHKPSHQAHRHTLCWKSNHKWMFESNCQYLRICRSFATLNSNCDTSDILRKLEGITFPQDVLITSIDVVSIYTNIRQTKAINCVRNALDQTNHPYVINKPPSEYIRKHLELIPQQKLFPIWNPENRCNGFNSQSGNL